jgi:hypothetical protein
VTASWPSKAGAPGSGSKASISRDAGLRSARPAGGSTGRAPAYGFPGGTGVSAQADLAAWDDAARSEFCSLAPVAQLAGRFRPLHGHNQLVHGDLTTNVLFHPTLPPGIIDLSPYWRPPRFATAVVVVDAMVWEVAGPSVLPLIGRRPHAAQYLLRAAVFRLVMDHLCNPRRRTPPSWWPSMLRVVRHLCDLAESADGPALAGTRGGEAEGGADAGRDEGGG